MVTFVLPGSDPSPRTPDCAPRGETGRERKGEYKGDGKRGVEGDREIRESVRGKREEGGEGNAPPVTPGGTTADSPSQGCAGTNMEGLGGLDGSRENSWGVPNESDNPALPGTNTAGEGTTRENDCPTPSGERLSDDLWTRHPVLTALGRGIASEYGSGTDSGTVPNSSATDADSLSKNTQDAEQTAGGDSDGDS